MCISLVIDWMYPASWSVLARIGSRPCNHHKGISDFKNWWVGWKFLLHILLSSVILVKFHPFQMDYMTRAKTRTISSYCLFNSGVTMYIHHHHLCHYIAFGFTVHTWWYSILSAPTAIFYQQCSPHSPTAFMRFYDRALSSHWVSLAPAAPT